MKEYEDEEIGDLEDYLDDESMDGKLDIHDDSAFNDAMDEFLAMQRTANDESIQTKSSKPAPAATQQTVQSNPSTSNKKKDFSILLADPAAAPTTSDAAEEEGHEDEEEHVELTPAEKAALEAEEAKEAEQVFASHEYIGAERPKLEWDCETILSTYSVLDNHPTMIKLPSKKKASRSNGATPVVVAPQRIILSKTGLPEAYLPERQAAKVGGGISLSEVQPAEPEQPVVDTSIGRRGETKEEKKERKAKLKQEQKDRRERKKATKEVFKVEEQQQLRRLANASSTQENMAVHRYA